MPRYLGPTETVEEADASIRKPDFSVILVHYNHPLPPRYWTGEKWTENRDEATVRSSFSLREFYNAQVATGTSSGGVTVEFATYKPTKVITSYKP